MRRGADNEDDDNLLRAARNGDEAAFARLLDRHRPWVCRLMQAIVQDQGYAEDLTQETFCRVYQGLDNYTARGQFVPWLKRIAVNRARTFLSDRMRDRRREEIVIGHTEQEQYRQNWSGDPATILDSRLLRQEVRDALEALSREQRQTLLLYYFGGQTIEEIAGATDCPEGTVKSRLFHARRQVRHKLRSALTQETTFPNERYTTNEKDDRS